MQKASSVSGEGRREGGKYLPTRILLPGKGFFLLKGEWMEHGPAPGVAQAGAAGPLPTGPLSQRHGVPVSPGIRSGGFWSLWGSRLRLCPSRPLETSPAARCRDLW